jgi:hypothetical protein
MRKGAEQDDNRSRSSPFLHSPLLAASLSAASPILLQLWLDSISQDSARSATGGDEAAVDSSLSADRLAVPSPSSSLRLSRGAQAAGSRWRPSQHTAATPVLPVAHNSEMSPLALSPLPRSPPAVLSSPVVGPAVHRSFPSSPASSRAPSPLTLLSSGFSPSSTPSRSLRAMWRSMSAQHAQEVESLLSRLRDAATGSSLHAWLTSRLRLTEMAFASSRRRIILSTAARMQQTARRAALRRFMQRWRAVTASQRQAQCRANEWAEQRRQRATARDRRQAIGHWLQVTSDSRAGDVIAQSRQHRLLRDSLMQWRQRLSQQLVQQRAALEFAHARREGERRRLLLQWLRLARQRRRERYQQLALMEWGRRRRLTALRRVITVWRHGSEGQRLCRRRVLQAMQRVGAQCDCSVPAALLYMKQLAESEASAAGNVRYRIVAFDLPLE